MLKNYFIVALRSLIKNKISSFINIFGLTLGMTVAIVIGLWIADELSYDRVFHNHQEIAEVMLNQTVEGTTYTGPVISPTVADPMISRFKDEFVASALFSYNDEHILAAGENKFSKLGRWVQPAYPEMFTFEMISGPRNSLKNPSTVMISRQVASALFGKEEALNKIIRIDNRFDMTVGGVFADLPENQSLGTIDFLLPWDARENWLNTITDWDNHSCGMFVQLRDPSRLEEISEKIKSIPTPYITEIKEEIMLYPLDDLFLHGDFKNGKAAGGRINFVWLVGIIGGFVLLIACINFMNLSTARSEKRAKEVGIRKTSGSAKSQLVAQFLVESIMTASIAMVAALAIAWIALPAFNSLAGKTMQIPWNSATLWISISAFVLISGIVAGSYPAFYLSSFKPVNVLKGKLTVGAGAVLPRKVLVVFQFSISLTLMIATIVVLRQIAFVKDRPVGYTRAGLITIPMKTPDLRGHYDAIRNDLLQTGAVENMAESSVAITGFNNNNEVDWSGKDKNVEVNFRDVYVTPEFGATVRWTMSLGRDFSREMVSDSSAVLINEAAADIMKIKNPIGENLIYFNKSYRIIAVVKNMVTRNPFDNMEPTMFLMGKYLDVITVRIKPEVQTQIALGQIRDVIIKHNPNAPFEYKFADDDYAKRFQEGERTRNLAAVFAGLSVVISCLGIFGLASFMAEQRSKEIGVRKVLGASVANVWALLSKDFLYLTLISCAISIPSAWYFMRDWLLQFNYHTPLSWWVFALASFLVIVITLVTVSFQSIKAAITNPVKALRTE